MGKMIRGPVKVIHFTRNRLLTPWDVLTTFILDGKFVSAQKFGRE
jgi:hypothetical protein